MIEDDIEEIATRAFLRDEVFKLHANFSLIDSLLTAAAAIPDTAPATPES